jgi:sulfur carrier protein
MSPIMSEPKTVTANGRSLSLEQSCSLADFLVRQQLLPRSVVVELNGEAVPPSEFGHRMVRPGDRLEIVRIVAGG